MQNIVLCVRVIMHMIGYDSLENLRSKCTLWSNFCFKIVKKKEAGTSG